MRPNEIAPVIILLTAGIALGVLWVLALVDLLKRREWEFPSEGPGANGRVFWAAVVVLFSAFGALLATLVLIFAFQADNITGRLFHVLLIAVPITIQVYFNSSLAYGLMKWLNIPYGVAAPGALIGASNFFELAVAAAISLFGFESGAALATVVGVLIEVPVMLLVVRVVNQSKGWYENAVPHR